MEAVTQVRDELQRQDLQTIIGRQKADTKDVFFKDMASRPPVELLPFTQALSSNASEGSDIALALRLLRTLRFNSMSFRYSKITDSHLNTFQWMFDNTFSRWLASSHPVFWISGKPGSGKSTLMKFLVDNDKLVSRYLSTWARGAKVITASYFFWVNGTEIQRSQEGLFRSLLYDLLRQNPQSIKHVFPQRWEWLQVGYTDEDMPPWSRQELMTGLSRLLHDKQSLTKYCIFIDGLDEYEGDHEELIRVIRNLVRSNSVRICIASRPWNVFEAAFGNEVAHKLYLEEFNRADIACYVRDNLEYHPDFHQIRIREPQAAALLSEITSRAQGVFLWVYLVVRSLVQGLQNRDRLVDLQRRLWAFPSDLDDFFNHILVSLDKTYRAQTARLFQVALAIPRPLSLLNYWYVDAEEDDPQFYSKMPVAQLEQREMQARQEEMHKRLNGRCKGLLEVTQVQYADAPYDCRVDFLHRTVKDFLRTKDMQQQLMQWTSHSLVRSDSGFERRSQIVAEPFNAYLTVCKSSLAELKSAPVKYGYLKGPGPMQDLISDFFFAAQQYESTMGRTLTNLISYLDGTIKQHVVCFPTQQPNYPWANWESKDVLTHAIRWNLLLHIKQGVDLKRLSTSERYHLLSIALTGRFRKNGDLRLGPDQHMIETLLDTGPTAPFDGSDIATIITSLALHNCEIDGLFGSLLLLAMHGSLKVKEDAPLWGQLDTIMAKDDIMTLKRTQKTVAREKRNPFRRWFSKGHR